MSMKKINFQNGVTPVSAETFNEFQNNIDAMFNGDNAMKNIVVEDIECKNIFSGFIKGVYNQTTGAYESEGNGITTKKMNVEQGGQYYLSGFAAGGVIRVHHWNNNTYVSNEVLNTPAVIVPKGNIIAFQTSTGASYNDVQIEKGSSATEYTEFKKYGYNENESMGSIIVDNVTCKNIFDGVLEEGSYDAYGNKMVASNYYRNVNPVLVKPNTAYTMSIDGVAQQYVMFFYDASKNFIKFQDNRTGTFTTPSNCYYVNFRCYQADFISNFRSLKVQIEKGEATNYVPHKEFSNKQIYSTSEQVVGTWIDGRPLYRKVLDFGSLPNAGTKDINIGTTNVKQVVKLQGFAFNSEGATMPLPYPNNSNVTQNVTMSYSGGTNGVIYVATGSDRSSFSAYIIVEYTKTTDVATASEVSTASLEEE